MLLGVDDATALAIEQRAPSATRFAATPDALALVAVRTALVSLDDVSKC